jgi:nucleoside-diphosphate-sugar epimerase
MSGPSNLQEISADTAPVLLTGATGFIGRRIQQILLDAGVFIRVILRPGSRHSQHIDPRCEVIEAGLTDLELLKQAANGIKAVIYCAGSVRGRRLEDFLPANVEGVANLLNALSSQDANTPLLLISSLAASRPHISDYANSKFLGEQTLHNQNSTPWTIIRPPAVYGPGDTEMLPLLKMARKGLGTRPGPEDQRVSLLYADDLASAVFSWLKNWQKCEAMTVAIDDGEKGGYDWPAIMQAAGKQRYRIVGIPRVLLQAIARSNIILSGVLGYAPMLTPGKVRELTQTDWLCDNTAFTRATGWQPLTDLESGIRLCLDD